MANLHTLFVLAQQRGVYDLAMQRAAERLTTVLNTPVVVRGEALVTQDGQTVVSGVDWSMVFTRSQDGKTLVLWERHDAPFWAPYIIPSQHIQKGVINALRLGLEGALSARVIVFPVVTAQALARLPHGGERALGASLRWADIQEAERRFLDSKEPGTPASRAWVKCPLCGEEFSALAGLVRSAVKQHVLARHPAVASAVTMGGLAVLVDPHDRRPVQTRVRWGDTCWESVWLDTWGYFHPRENAALRQQWLQEMSASLDAQRRTHV